MSEEFDAMAIQEAVRTRYAEVARSAVDLFPYRTGKAGALQLGYDLSILGATSDVLFESFCGVGNPFSLGDIHLGEALLDIGCGAGLDLLIASRSVGPTGWVCGIDLTPAMVEKAQQNLERMGVSHGQARQASSEAIPYDDSTFDVVISNGVLNLSPEKEKSFREIFRVLKPNGRVQFADIVLNENLPIEVATNLDAWSN